MKREDKARLLFGPYHSPTVAPGGTLECRIRGRVKVDSWSQGRIAWPRTKTGALILCGELVKAVLQESKPAIKYHWGVSDHTVREWRRTLKAEPYNTGTQWLMRALAGERATGS